MPDARDSIKHTLLIALSVSLVCSVVVAAAAVLLRPRIEQNELLALRTDIIDVAGLRDTGQSADEAFALIKTRLVDLATGEYVADDDSFDARRDARDPELSVRIPPEQDIAQIARRAKLARAFLVYTESGELERVVFPVNGQGLWSMLYGLIAVSPDGRQVLAIKFYEHAETPGLGDQIDDEDWRAQWHGKRIFDDTGQLRLEVIKGAVRPNDPDAAYRIDGLSGATLTGRGASNAVRYWLGEHGYGAFLDRLQARQASR